MRKVYICIVLFCTIFITTRVKADQINAGFVNSNGVVTSNISPFTWVNGAQNANNNFVINGTAVDGSIQIGQRYQVISSFCSQYGRDDEWNISLNNSARLIINSYNITKTVKNCAHTDSNGVVHTGTNVLTISVDMTIGDISSVGTLLANFKVVRSTSGGGINVGFISYDILDDVMINDNDNTDRIIDNDNNNTDRIVDAQNATTDAVNGLNNNINNTDTTGSENALSSIINDPAFQDNTGINSIITLPVTMISSLSNSCQPINLTIPFLNSSVELPCFRSVINQHMPLVANLIGIVVNGFILYRILIDIVGIVKSARNPDEDRLDVLEL